MQADDYDQNTENVNQWHWAWKPIIFEEKTEILFGEISQGFQDACVLEKNVMIKHCRMDRAVLFMKEKPSSKEAKIRG